MQTNVFRSAMVSLLVFLYLCLPIKAWADDVYPTYIYSHYSAPLTKLGSGVYRRFGFRIYVATLWAENPVWEPQKPYLLELKYLRDVSKDTLVDNAMDDIRDQGAQDDQTFSRWQNTLMSILPAVREGDILSGLCLPNNKTRIYLNGVEIASLEDDKLSKAFFNMWFGANADPELHDSLLQQQNSPNH